MRRWSWLAAILLLGVFCTQPAISRPPSRTAKRLIKALKDRSFKVRLQAAILIGKRKVKRAIPSLRKVLASDREHAAVRAAAASSLGKLGDEESRAQLVKLIGHRSRLLVRATEKALMSLDKHKGVPVYYVKVAKPKLPKGVASSRGFRLVRIIKDKIKNTGGLVVAAGEDQILQGKDFESHLKRRQLTGLELRPKLVTLSEDVGDDTTTVNGKVSIMIVTLPKKRMEFNSGGEANSWIEGTNISDGERTDMENTVLDASADAAVMQVLEYLQNRSEY